MTRKQRIEKVLAHFLKKQPPAQTELNYYSPFELLIAVILSAQCTDIRVNKVTPTLFSALSTPKEMAAASAEEIFSYISSISYPNNKAKYLQATAEQLCKNHGGQVPKTVEELRELPGVGRKTAHVIASILYRTPVLAVDTHVFRVARRMGLVSQSAHTPRRVEEELVKHIPQELVPDAHHWLILHGRYQCRAQRPLCENCELQLLCQFRSQKSSRLS